MHVQRFSNLGGSPFDLMLVKRTLARDFMDSMRVAAIQWLAAPFGGDEMLGELLLLQLVCKSPKVTNGAVTRRFTLNICGMPKATTGKGNVDSSKVSSAAANHPYGRIAVDMPSPGSCLPAGTTSVAAEQVAAAVSAIYPFVQILPATDQVQHSLHMPIFCFITQPRHELFCCVVVVPLAQLLPQFLRHQPVHLPAYTLRSMPVGTAFVFIRVHVYIVKVTELQMCVQTTGCQQLMPNHSSASNRLHPGVLQQAPHSCLIVDECISSLSTPSQEHDAWRCRNMRAMHEYVRDGVLTANYMWQQVRLPVSGSVLVVSDEPSTFSDSCRICISASGAPESATAGLDASVHPLQGIRCYLACAWDLWEGLEYERQDGANIGTHPRWVAETLVSGGKRVAAAVNSSGAAACDTTRAYETAVMLLHCLCISQGKNQISRDDWGAVDHLVASCQARSSGAAATAPPLKNREQTVPAAAQTRHVPPSADRDMAMDTGDNVLRERQPQQEVSAGQAMVDALRRTGAL